MPRLEAGTTLVARYDVKELETSPHFKVEQWRAEDKIFGREVNVYAIDPSVVDGALDRARKSAQLNTERIARVLDIVDRGPDQRFIITERPEGIPTAAAISSRPFSMAQTKAVIGSIASSLVKVAEAQGLRHGAITSDSIYFKNETVTLTGLVPRNFLGLNEGIDDDTLALKDTRGLAALTYFMLTGLMANYGTEQGTPLPKLLGFVKNADENVDTYTTDILNFTNLEISTPEQFLEALGEWSVNDLPLVHPVPVPEPPKVSEPAAIPPARMSAKSAATSAVPIPSSIPTPQSTVTTPAMMGGAAATLAAAGILGNEEVGADSPSTTSPDATAARAVSGPPRFLPTTTDVQLGEPAPSASSSTPAAAQAHWTAPPASAEKQKSGLSATPFVLGLFALALIGGVTWAVGTLKEPMAPAIVAPSARPSESADNEAAKPEPTKDVVLPVTKSAQSLDPHGDNNEHPELQDLLVDGDVTTPWYSRTYKTSDFGGIDKSGIGVQVGLEEKATVSSVLISSLNTGGMVEIRATNAKNPEKGTVLAKGPLDGETQFKLSEPVETSSVVIWFTDMPQDQDGKYRIYLYEISLT